MKIRHVQWDNSTALPLSSSPHCLPVGLRCLQSVLLDWAIAERNLLNVGEDRFCNTGDIQVEKKGKKCLWDARLNDSIADPANCSWPLTSNCLCGLLKNVNRACCPRAMLHQSDDSWFCWIWPLWWHSWPNALFFLYFFSFLTGSMITFITDLFFFFSPLAAYGLCVNERDLQVTPGSKAAQGDLCPGDIILAINGDSTELMTHMEAQNRIKTCTQQLTLIVTR